MRVKNKRLATKVSLLQNARPWIWGGVEGKGAHYFMWELWIWRFVGALAKQIRGTWCLHAPGVTFLRGRRRMVHRICRLEHGISECRIGRQRRLNLYCFPSKIPSGLGNWGGACCLETKQRGVRLEESPEKNGSSLGTNSWRRCSSIRRRMEVTNSLNNARMGITFGRLRYTLHLATHRNWLA